MQRSRPASMRIGDKTLSSNRVDAATRSEKLEAMASKVAESAAQLKQIQDASPQETRVARAERGNPFAPPAVEGVEVIESSIVHDAGKTRVRRYYPSGSSFDFSKPVLTGSQRPALVYFHGGGYVLGDVAQYDTLTQQLAERANCIVISVDYQLAPEARSKQIFAEAFSVYRWLCANGADWGIDTSKIAVGGDSAGGNLSIAVGLNCKASRVPQPCFQLLLYPVTDYTMSFPSITEFSSGYFLTKAGMEWFRSHFLEDASRATDPIVSPHFADVAGLAPAFVLTAGFDPLRDEGEAFARKLSAAGVAVRHVCYTDMIHAFISFAGGIEAGMEAIEESAQALRNAFASVSS